eukprot:scaffold5603_cov125-Isochrysis_galbana.AAC.3
MNAHLLLHPCTPARRACAREREHVLSASHIRRPLRCADRPGCSPGLLLSEHRRALRPQKGRGADEEKHASEERLEVEQCRLRPDGKYWRSEADTCASVSAMQRIWRRIPCEARARRPTQRRAVIHDSQKR